MLVGREAEGFDDAPFNRIEGWGPDCHKWTGTCMPRTAEECAIIGPPNPFGTLDMPRASPSEKRIIVTAL
jgi:hypothetical protein